jgi:germination protein M
MTNDSFIENPGEQINSIQTSVITLYFANQEGNGLVRESQEVHYSSNISMEKLVMEHLLEGPESEEAQSAIPDGTKLVNVSVLDGVCYVSLDEGFLNQNYNIEEPVVIYSIVNSLSEISTINQVQISVNGDTSGTYRDSFALDELYERNLDYVTETEEEVETVE